jgi:phosphomannomutase
MVHGLDPHSDFLDADAFKELQVSTQGKFGGLGIEVGVEDGIVRVTSPIEDTPAFRAGIKAGDLIVKIDDTATRGLPLSKLLRSYRERYFLSGEINVPVRDVAVKIQEIKERFGVEGTVSHLDGISIEAEDWHLNVRPSNTEPLLRLNLEALSRDLMETKRDEVLELLG